MGIPYEGKSEERKDTLSKTESKKEPTLWADSLWVGVRGHQDPILSLKKSDEPCSHIRPEEFKPGIGNVKELENYRYVIYEVILENHGERPKFRESWGKTKV